MERYVIRDGQAGFDRLGVLARAHGPQTGALFDEVGVGSGMSCLDLGCGGGAVSFELARRVGPGGVVVGVDADAAVLALAREAAESQGVSNVEFRVGSVYDVSETESYDVAYCRFLLQHLSRPRDVLRSMWSAVRPGGVVVVEDADFEGLFCEPASPAADLFRRLYPPLLERTGGDASCGRKLYGYFQDVGITEPHLGLVQVVHATGEAKTLQLLTVAAIGHDLVREGLASEGEIEETLPALAAYTEDPRTILGSPRVFQVWARK